MRKTHRENALNLILQREADMQDIADLAIQLKSRIIKSERVHKLPRSTFEDTLGQIEEHFREQADAAEEQGLDMFAGNIDAWVECVNKFHSSRTIDPPEPVNRIREIKSAT
jgi:hypothetical protein